MDVIAIPKLSIHVVDLTALTKSISYGKVIKKRDVISFLLEKINCSYILSRHLVSIDGLFCTKEAKTLPNLME